MKWWHCVRLIGAMLGVALLVGAPVAAHAKALVADLSAYRIPIASDFRGARVFLFGARGSSGQVVVVVRGPERRYLVRKKEPVLGMWLVRKQLEFGQVPQFYSLASTAPLDLISTPELRHTLQLGHGAIPMQPVYNGLTEAEVSEFQTALRDHLKTAFLHTESTNPVRFIGDSLFKAEIAFPDTIQPGNYVADVYLLDGSGLAASQSIPIRVRKRGLEATLSRGAHEYPLTYGLCAVLIAMLAGWGAHRAFQRIG